jgi:hypothetical protein
VDIFAAGPGIWGAFFTVPTLDRAALEAASFILKAQEFQQRAAGSSGQPKRSRTSRQLSNLWRRFQRKHHRKRRKKRGSRRTRQRRARARRQPGFRLQNSAWRSSAREAIRPYLEELHTRVIPDRSSTHHLQKQLPWTSLILLVAILFAFIVPVAAPSPDRMVAAVISSAEDLSVAASLVVASATAASATAVSWQRKSTRKRTREQPRDVLKNYFCVCIKHPGDGEAVTRSVYDHHKKNRGHLAYEGPPLFNCPSSSSSSSSSSSEKSTPASAPQSPFFDRRPRYLAERFVAFMDLLPDDAVDEDPDDGQSLANPIESEEVIDDNFDNPVPVNGNAAQLDAEVDDGLADIEDDILDVEPPQDRSGINEVLQTELLNDLKNHGVHRFAARLLQSTLGGSATLAQANDVLANLHANIFPMLQPDGVEIPRTIKDCIKLLRPTFGSYQRLDVCQCEQHVFGHHSTDHAETCPLYHAQRWTAATRAKQRRLRKPAWRDIHHLDTEGSVRRWFAARPISELLSHSSDEFARIQKGEKDGTLPTGVEREIGDVYTGRLWREKFHPRFGRLHRKNLAFMFTTDGGAPFKKSSVNLWPHLLICLNFPPAMRQKPGFTLMAGLVDVDPKNGKRKMKNFHIHHATTSVDSQDVN